MSTREAGNLLSMMGDRSLRVVGLGKRYFIGKKSRRKELWALKDVSLDIERGTILGVIGPNGAGKTTLLRILSRVTPPTEGKVYGRGRVVPLMELGSSFSPELTGRENIFLNAAMHGIPRSQIEAKFDDIVQFADVERFIDTPLRHYSSGMYLRIAFSVAMNVDPDILLADEVLAVGDIDFQERCLQRVRKAGESGMTVLFVSHDMSAISRLCHKVLWIQNGTIIKYGEPGEVVTAYQNDAWSLTSRRQEKADKRSTNHVNEWGEILDIKLLSDQEQEIGAVRISDDVFIDMLFEIKSAGLEVRCAADIFALGALAFRSIQPEITRIDHAGLYRARVRIQRDLLAETLYSVSLSVNMSMDGEDKPIVRYRAVSFKVYNTNESDSARGSFNGRMGGVVMPRLDWTMTED